MATTSPANSQRKPRNLGIGFSPFYSLCMVAEAVRGIEVVPPIAWINAFLQQEFTKRMRTEIKKVAP